MVFELSAKGYWPAVALEYFQQRKFSRAVELCQLRLVDNPDLISGRTILARALFHSGQYNAAEDQFYKILQKDPDNLVALKYLGDVKFRKGDAVTAFSYYERVRQIDRYTSGLASLIADRPVAETRLLALRKGEEKAEDTHDKLREIPFRTETLGDLLLAQGHPRLALKVFRELAEGNLSPQLHEKIESIEESIQTKEKKNV